jgi:hypothetical protein
MDLLEPEPAGSILSAIVVNTLLHSASAPDDSGLLFDVVWFVVIR